MEREVQRLPGRAKLLGEGQFLIEVGLGVMARTQSPREFLIMPLGALLSLNSV